MINCCSNNLQVCTSLEKWHTAQLMPPGIFGLDYILPLLFLLLNCSVVSDSLQPHELQPARFPCPSLSPGVCSNSSPLNQLRHPASAISFSSCLQSFSASGYQVAKVLELSSSISPYNEQSGLISFMLIGLISLLSKGLSRVLSSTTV